MIISAHRLMALISGIQGASQPYDNVPEVDSWPGIRTALQLTRRDTDYFARAAVQLIVAHASIAGALRVDPMSTCLLKRTDTFFGNARPDMDVSGLPVFWPRTLAFPPSLKVEIKYQSPVDALVSVDGLQFTIGVRSVSNHIYFNWTENVRDIAGFRGSLVLPNAWNAGTVVSWTYEPMTFPSQLALEQVINHPELQALLAEAELMNDFHASRAPAEKLSIIFAALAVTNPSFA